MAKEDFNLPTDYERDLDDLPLPDFSTIQPSESLLPISEEQNFSEVGATNEEVVFQPEASVGGESFTEFKGWQILVEGAALIVKLQPAKLFFPLSTGVIGGIMPTMQATGTALDNTNGSGENDWPTHTLTAAATYSAYLLYDSVADTVRVFFLIEATDVATVLAADEEALLFATVVTNGTGIESIDQSMFGPEAIGGGGASCTNLNPFVETTTLDVTAGISNELAVTIPTAHAIVAAINAYLVHTVTPVAVDDGAGTWVIGDTVTVTDPRIVYEADATAAVEPDVSGSTGGAATIVDGEMYALWAVVEETAPASGEWAITTNRCGNVQTIWCSGTLRVIID
jgi:hypothetical protein